MGACMGNTAMGSERSAPDAAGAYAEDGVRRVDIGTEWICIRRRIAGLETWVNVPTQSYRGVTLRVKPTGAFEIVLLHVDANLDVTLLEAPDDRDVIASWRAYARETGLPLLVEDREGRLQPVPDAPAPRPSQRRAASPLKHRRPRFLARRHVGSAGVPPVHRGESEFPAWG